MGSPTLMNYDGDYDGDYNGDYDGDFLMLYQNEAVYHGSYAFSDTWAQK